LGPLLIEAFRYHRWANLHLLDVCAKLSDEQLQLTSPGTYGTIAATFHHLIGAEQRYLVRLEGGKAATSERDDFPGIAALRKIAESSGDRLIQVAGTIKPDTMIDANWEEGKVKLPLAVVVIQALHHGTDHRTHICTILGHHEMPYGEMDVWAYGDATGAVVHLPSNG
jgi:uncharacterized damage-inducible protein DinB